MAVPSVSESIDGLAAQWLTWDTIEGVKDQIARAFGVPSKFLADVADASDGGTIHGFPVVVGINPPGETVIIHDDKEAAEAS